MNTALFTEEGSSKVSRATNKQIDVKNIDSQIESLENLKDYYLAKATRLRSRGDRIQFNSKAGGVTSAQKCWRSANQYDKIADQIQGEIDNLKAERDSVQNKSGY